MTDDTVDHFIRAIGFGLANPDSLYATFTLRNAQSLSGWRSCDERCDPPQVLGDGGQYELILGASWTTKAKPAQLQDALQVRKPHLDLLALPSRCLKALRANERSGDVAGMLMDIAWDLARWVFRTALRFEWANVAISLAGAIQKRLALVHGAARPKPLSARAMVDVAGRVISEVAAREGAITASASMGDLIRTAADIVKLFVERARALGLTHREVEERADLGEGYFSKIACGDRRPTAVTIEKLCSALDVGFLPFVGGAAQMGVCERDERDEYRTIERTSDEQGAFNSGACLRGPAAEAGGRSEGDRSAAEQPCPGAAAFGKPSLAQEAVTVLIRGASQSEHSADANN